MASTATNKIPCTSPATFGDLINGDLFAFSGATLTARALSVHAHASWGVRVSWDHGPCSKAYSRIFPRGNSVQIAWRR